MACAFYSDNKSAVKLKVPVARILIRTNMSCDNGIAGNLFCCNNTSERKAVLLWRLFLYFCSSPSKISHSTSLMIVAEHVNEPNKLM